MRRFRSMWPGLLLLSPSLIALGIFVYGFMGWNLRVSFTSWRGLAAVYDNVGFRNYESLFRDERFILDIKHVLIFTLVFVGGSMILGFTMAVLLDRGVRGEGIFRTVFLLPMAISFIATAIIWRWLLNNGAGDQTAGINKIFEGVGLGFLRSDWFKTDSVWAISAVALPAGWALSGYIMALFLAGLRGIPEELREAARVDGATEPKVFWYVVRPMLLPVVMSALVILAHISLKTFDLLYAIDLKNINIDVPAVYMWFTVFEGGFYARGATIATLLLLGVAVVIVPYIWYSMRSVRKG